MVVVNSFRDYQFRCLNANGERVKNIFCMTIFDALHWSVRTLFMRRREDMVLNFALFLLPLS